MQEKEEVLKVVLDTNVLISSTLWLSGEAYRLLEMLIKKGVKIFASVDIFSEYLYVLNRDFEYKKEELLDNINRILSFLEIIDPKIKIDFVEEDPDDNKILECAVEAEADIIVTYDKHLLSIREFENIRIVKPKEAMRLLK